MTRTPYVMETARSNIYNPDGSTPVAATTDFIAADLGGVDAITGDTTGSAGDVIAYSVAPTPAGSTFAWTVTGTATIDPVAADTESVNITFTDAATYTVTCVVTLAGDADSPKTITSTVVIS